MASDFPPQFYALIRRIDRFSDLTGKLISLSMLWLVVTIFPGIAMWFPQWLEAGDRMATPAQDVDQSQVPSLEAGDQAPGDDEVKNAK